MSTLSDRIDVAYSKLGLRESFIAAVMTRVKREISDRVPTAGTNGTWVRFNPAFCDPLTDEELFGLVLHESVHVVLMHMWRRESRDPSLWNYANDALINAYIRSRGWQLPKGGVNVHWVRESMSSEEVYAKLKENPPPPRKGSGSGDGDDDGKPDGYGDPCLGSEDMETFGDVWHMMQEAVKLPPLQEEDFSPSDYPLGEQE